MPDEGHVTAQIFIGGRVRHAEDLAQTANAVGLEHFDVHTFGDAVFDPVFADIEPIIGETAVLDPPVMIRLKKLRRRANPWLTVSMISVSVKPSAFISRHMAITA